MAARGLDFDRHFEKLHAAQPLTVYGKVHDVVGLTIEASGPPSRIGDLCYVRVPDTGQSIPVEVVGFRGKRTLLMPLADSRGIGPESLLLPTGAPLQLRAGPSLVGRVVGGLGNPLDNGPPLRGEDHINVMASPPRPLERTRITRAIATGIRAIDACVTCGRGQRLGVMAGSGVGKSKLMGMIARNTNADISVIGLIGERGREVRDFIESDLGSEGLKRSVVVAATSDEPALVRIKGAYLATAIAEYFRDQGLDVMLMMDSVTRFAMAQREVGLAVGEPPTTKGYPPSVYSLLPKLLERAGTSARGSVTGIYTVLVEADDMNDPIADAVRSILDGHVVLSRDLASRGHYPAVDVLESISRVMIDVTTPAHQDAATKIRRVLAVHRDAQDLINIGAYVKGSNTDIDEAIRLSPGINKLLQQRLDEATTFDEIAPRMAGVIG
jgi:flagellum-specific ATP synthase